MLNPITPKTMLVLNHLDYVKQTGQGKWLARCPAHDDRSPSLAIKEVEGRVLIHCFAGCSVMDVLQAVGLKMANLFPDKSIDPYAPKPKTPKFSAYELFPLLVQEALILALGWEQLYATGVIGETDCQRVIQAYQSVMRLHAEVSR